MKLTTEQKELLKKLMVVSTQKGNLANSGLVLENEEIIASAESWVVSSCDATAHSERMLVTLACNLKHSNWTPGLTMISVIEPCLMCLSACSQAGYKEIGYIISAKQYIEKVPWMSDTKTINKQEIAKQFSSPIKLTHISEYENEFCEIFEKEMAKLLK